MLVATATAIAGPLAIKAAIDRGITASPADFGQIEIWVGVFAALTVINWVTSSGQTYLTSWVGTRILADLRIGLFAHIQKLDLGFFERNRAGVVISRLTNDIEALVSAVVDGPTTLVQNTIVLVGSAAVLVYVNWKLAIATLTVFPGMAIGTAIFRYYSGRAYRADAPPPGGGHRAAPGGHLGRARRPGLPARGHQLRAVRRDQRPLPRGQRPRR